MSIVELKCAARDRRGIKGYHCMKKAELIAILSTEVLPPHLRYAKKTIKQLREEAKEAKIPYVLRFTKQELMDRLYPAADTCHKDAKDNDSTHTHDPHNNDDPE